MDLGLLGALLSIIVIDLVLSGDNAVVIGMAASRLDPVQRRRAIIWGGGGAIGLRIFFTAIAALLLDIPLLQGIGAVLLLYIAVKLLRPVIADPHGNISAANSFREAFKTIIMADVIMSLDNILAVGGAAHGNLWLLIFGLLLSIPILLFASGLVARMIHQYPVLNYIGAGVLAITALRMFFHDPVVHDYIALDTWLQYAIIAAGTATVLAYGYWMNRAARRELIETAEAAHSERARGRAEEQVAP